MVSVTVIWWNLRLWVEEVTSPIRRKAWNIREYIACIRDASYDDLVICMAESNSLWRTGIEMGILRSDDGLDLENP